MKFIISALLLLFIVACEGIASWPAEKFASTAWQCAPEQERYRYVQDLLDNETLIGRSREDVVRILGQPSSGAVWGDMDYVVKVGGKSFDQVFILEVRFTKGVVTQALVRSD